MMLAGGAVRHPAPVRGRGAGLRRLLVPVPARRHAAAGGFPLGLLQDCSPLRRSAWRADAAGGAWASVRWRRFLARQAFLMVWLAFCGFAAGRRGAGLGATPLLGWLLLPSGPALPPGGARPSALYPRVAFVLTRRCTCAMRLAAEPRHEAGGLLGAEAREAAVASAEPAQRHAGRKREEERRPRSSPAAPCCWAAAAGALGLLGDRLYGCRWRRASATPRWRRRTASSPG